VTKVWLHPTEGNLVSNKLDDLALDRLFRTARTRNAWTDRPVTEQELRELYDLVKFGPTSSNCCPARFVWVRSAEGKGKLAALAAPGNAPKILAAPVTVIVGYDLDFAEQMPRLFPARGKEMQGYFFRSPGGANDRLSRVWVTEVVDALLAAGGSAAAAHGLPHLLVHRKRKSMTL